MAKGGNVLFDDSGAINEPFSSNAGITASVTQTQGQQALTKVINEISTCANDDDTVTLPSADAGLMCIVINNGAKNLQIFPASGQNLGAGNNTSTKIPPNTTVIFHCYAAASWITKDIKEYCIAGRSSSTYNMAAGVRIQFNSVQKQSPATNKISLDTSTNVGRFTLQPGNYKLSSGLRTGLNDQDVSEYQWYDVTNAAFIGIKGAGDCNWATTGDQPNATAFVHPTAATEYELRCTAVVNSPSISSDGYSFIMVQEIQ